MTQTNTVRIVLVVTAACGLAMAGGPVWYPAQQAPNPPAQQAPNPAPQQTPNAPEGQTTPAQTPQPPAAEPTPTPEAPLAPIPAPKEDTRTDQPMQPIEPVAPAGGGSSSSTAPSAAPQAAPMLPDTTPLNSPLEVGIGSLGGGRSYFMPSFRFSETAYKTTGIPGQTDVTNVMTMAGTGVWVHSWTRANLTLRSTGGGTIFPSQSDLNSWFDDLQMTLSWQIQRWSFILVDNGSYLPESPFGFYGTAGTGGGPLGPGYIPNGTLFTPVSPRYTNTASLTMSRPLSPRSTIHFSANWGILRFQGEAIGLNNTDQVQYSAGYDRSLGRNTIGLAYNGAIYTTGGTSSSATTHSVNLAYSRRITGRMGLQVSAGPQVRIVDDPVLGTDTQPTWNVRAALQYALGKTSLSTSFSRNTGASAGVGGAGTQSAIWEASASRTLGRQWSTSGSFGISHNSTLQSPLLPERTFSEEFAYFEIGRMVGRSGSVYFSYNFQHQTTNFPICLGCGDSFDRHVLGMGFSWQGRPMTGIF